MCDADDVGGLAGISGVENAANLFVSAKKGVGFVDEEGGLEFLDDAEEGGGADVGGDNGAMDELTENAEKGGFAATFFGGFQADVGADVAEVKSVGVQGPQGESLGAPLGEDDVPGDETGQVVQKKAAVDGRIPRGDILGPKSWGLSSLEGKRWI